MSFRENKVKKGRHEVKSSETASKSATSAGSAPQKPLDEGDTLNQKNPLGGETRIAANPGWESHDHDKIEPIGKEMRMMPRSNTRGIPRY